MASDHSAEAPDRFAPRSCPTAFGGGHGPRRGGPARNLYELGPTTGVRQAAEQARVGTHVSAGCRLCSLTDPLLSTAAGNGHPKAKPSIFPKKASIEVTAAVSPVDQSAV